MYYTQFIQFHTWFYFIFLYTWFANYSMIHFYFHDSFFAIHSSLRFIHHYDSFIITIHSLLRFIYYYDSFIFTLHFYALFVDFDISYLFPHALHTIHLSSHGIFTLDSLFHDPFIFTWFIYIQHYVERKKKEGVLLKVHLMINGSL